MNYEESLISRTEQYTDVEGVTKEIVRSRAVLLPGVVPRIFPSLPSYLSSPESIERTDPEVRRKKILEEIDRKNEELINEDIINNSTDLC